MKADTWFPFYVNDYLGKTMHLTRDEHGAYILLIMAAWSSGGRLPNRPRALAAIVKATLSEWEEIAPAVLPYFTVEGDFLVQPRVVEEREKAQRLSDAKRENGTKGGRPKKQTETGGKASEKLTETEPETGTKANAKLNETPQEVARPSPSHSSVSNETGASPPDDDLAELRRQPVAKGCWRLGIKILTERGGMAEAAARSFVGKIKGLGLNDDDLWSICEDAWKAGTLDPKPYLAAAAEALVQRRSGQLGILAPTERQQRAWCEDFRDKPFQWKAHERGPKPGEPGCRIAPTILAEFGLTPADRLPA